MAASDYMSVFLQNGIFAKFDGENIVRFPTIVNMHEDIGVNTPIISIKGWGSKIMQSDVDSFTFNYDMANMKPFYIQWDGDKIANENFTRYILEISTHYHTKIMGYICTKAKKNKDMLEITSDIGAFFNKNGLTALVKYNKPIYVGVSPLEDHALHSASKYGIFGAIINNMFKPTLILYFGGGMTIAHEFNHEFFRKNTPRITFDITRNNKGELPTQLPDIEV
jgi:hypothetical protein